MANGYFSKERRAQRRSDREAKRRERAEVRLARLRVREARDEARLADTRRSLAAVGAGRNRSPSSLYAAPMNVHAERHGSPSHHVGPCDEACRAGVRVHEHRR